jgi:hypothetical protein
MSNPVRPLSRRTPYIPVTPIEGFRTQYIAHLLRGESRANLLKKIYKSFVRTNPNLVLISDQIMPIKLYDDFLGLLSFNLVFGLCHLFIILVVAYSFEGGRRVFCDTRSVSSYN